MDLNSEIDALIGEVSGVELDRIRSAVDQISKQPRMMGFSLVAFSTRSGFMICAADNDSLMKSQAAAKSAPINPEEARMVLPVFTANIIGAMDILGAEHPTTQGAFEEGSRVLMIALSAPPAPGRFYLCHAGLNLRREPFAFVIAGRHVRAQ